MSLEINIRQATQHDAPEIAAIKQSVWPDEAVDVAQMAKAIQKPTHVTQVGIHANTIIGFIDGFSTYSARGIHRWEVDLLAVHPDYRGNRVGERLVRANTKAGFQRGAGVARGLIRIENIASQRTFARCAYHSQGPLGDLFVVSRNPSPEDAILFSQQFHLVSVTTLTYTGCWLEIDLPSHTHHEKSHIRMNTDWSVMGVLIPIEEKEIYHTVQKAGFTNTGRFQYWTLLGMIEGGG
jgi:GNAT superfamily N-acetyltransferase